MFRTRMVKKKVKVKKETSKYFKLKYLLPLGVILLIVLLLLVLLYSNVFAKVAEMNETVSVNYILSLEDGTVFDTNIEEVSLVNGLNKTVFEPFEFTLGNNEVILGFEQGVIGMSVDETKIFTVPPLIGYGESSSQLIFELSLLQKINRFDEVNIEDYNLIFNETPKIGEIKESDYWPWKLKVIGINETSVQVENLLTVGEEIALDKVGWTSIVTSIDEKEIKVMQHPKLGDFFIIPSATGVMQGEVTNVGEVNFTVDFNSPLVGKNLVFKVTLLSIKEVKE